MSTGDGNTYTAERDVSAVERLLDHRQLIVASNREPYAHEFDGDDVAVSRPTGGLTAALDPVIQSLGGTWIAWGSGDADETVVDENDRVDVPPESPAYELRRVWLDDDAVAGYYYGYSNQVLWPVCHGLPSKVTYDDGFWASYRRVNDQFAAAVAEEVDDADPVVWFHDYHFGLAPRTVRRRLGRSALLLQFWHVPWPPWDVFRRCPHGREVVAALLHNDLVGFHTDRDRRNFAECADRALDASIDPSTGAVVHDGRRTRVRAAPLSIDADAFATRARSASGAKFWRSFADEHGLDDGLLAVGVDRLDYTKGIEERLDALERLWADCPEWRGGLTYVQNASESRSHIDEYQAVQRRVEERVDRLNRRFGTGDWQPVVYHTGRIPQDGLAALYRRADVALVSPRRDGMNLVAKEYVASQVDADGVLVLSETAGASEALGDGALTVTPLDTAGFADAVRRALEMPAAERRRRMRGLRRRVRATDSRDWVAGLFEPFASTPNAQKRDQ